MMEETKGDSCSSVLSAGERERERIEEAGLRREIEGRGKEKKRGGRNKGVIGEKEGVNK